MRSRRKVDWRSGADAVAAAVPRSCMDPEVLAALGEYDGPRRTWSVALSGGADSVLLLLLLWAHWPEKRRTLRALHFDHRLRGAASSADAAFCRRLCRALGVPLVVGRWTRRGDARRRRTPSEQDARIARLAFLHGHGRTLWFGHHQDDVAETLLMRLARGSGAGGLAAPRPLHVFESGRVHLRPLLGLKKARITSVLRDAGLPWCEDVTNGQPDYFRNRIRHDVIPAWVGAAQRDAVGGAARTRQLLAEDDAALELWADRLSTTSKSGDLLLSRMRGLPVAILRRVLYRWLQSCPWKVDVSRQAFDALLASARSGKPTRHSIGREGFVTLRRGRLIFERRMQDRKFQRRVN